METGKGLAGFARTCELLLFHINYLIPFADVLGVGEFGLGGDVDVKIFFGETNFFGDGFGLHFLYEAFAVVFDVYAINIKIVVGGFACVEISVKGFVALYAAGGAEAEVTSPVLAYDKFAGVDVTKEHDLGVASLE